MAGSGSGGDYTLEKSLPSNVEAERMILGVILLDNVTINQAAEHLKPDDFFLPSHRRIFEKMLKLYGEGQGIDPLTLQEELRRAGELDQVGGPAYIASLFDGVPRFSNIESYVKIVKGKGMLRRLVGAGNQIMQMAFDDEDLPEEVLDRAERLILSIAEDRIKQGFAHIGEVAEKQLHVIEEVAAHQQLITGVATGFTDLDYMTSGMQRGDLIIVAARPSMGKCLTADAEILLTNGEVATIEDIYRRQQAELLTLGDDFKFKPASPSAFVDDGVKPVYRVTTRLGRQVDSTLAHPYLTIQGWRRLEELQVGDRIAAPRRLPVFGSERLPEGRVKALAYLIGDGNLTNASPSFVNSNPLLQQDFVACLRDFPGLKVRHVDDGKRTSAFYVAGDGDFIKAERGSFAARLTEAIPRGQAHSLSQRLGVAPSLISLWRKGECVPSQPMFERLCADLNIAPGELALSGVAGIRNHSRNSLTVWLEELGLRHRNSHDKFIPAIVFRLRQPQLALFLNRLFATDGWVAITHEQNPTLGYATVSQRLARQVQHLLLRFGVIAKLRKRAVKYADTRRESWQLDITHGDSIRAFASQIGIFGKEEKLAQALTLLSEDEQLWSLAQSDVYWDEIVSIEYQGEKQVYDLTIPETHNFVANDICVHNTAFSLNIAQNAALGQDSSGRVHEDRQKAVVGVFSLEMSKEQLVQRLMCSQAQVDAHRLRSGMLNKDDWRRLALAVGELSQADIFLDDTPGITTLEVRAKARRLKNEQKRLDLLIIDYLQLMSGKSGRSESRQQEVSQISRELKILAKELEVPLIALSQLSRATETRTDHRPQLSDLRESGCLTGESQVVLADSGERIPIRELVGLSNFAVLALNEATMKLERANVSRAFSTGNKPVFRLTTRLGRQIRATANHKFRTFLGWKRLDELLVGERLALPRALPSSRDKGMTNSELALLGHLIGDGCTLPRHSIQYTTRERDLAEIVARLASEVFGDQVEPRIKQERTWYQVYLSSTKHHTHNVRSAVAEWLTELGVWGLRSHEKRVPENVFGQSVEAIGLFLRHLWATDGCIRPSVEGRAPAVYYASSSEQLARNVQSLLLRLGINASLRRVGQGEKGRDQFHVILSGKPDLECFAEKVGAVGEYKSLSLQGVVDYLNNRQANTNRDVIPNAVWRQMVVPAMQSAGVTTRQMMAGINTAYCGTKIYQQNVSRERASRIAQVVQSDKVARLAQSDVYWDEVVSIESDGTSDVYDLTVDGHHNFIANDIIVHNSIEQDADVVMFIYREEVYKPETEKQNIAEIIIGKQRNGPIGSIELVFRKALTRFHDMSRETME